jgi:hypothetical protein
LNTAISFVRKSTTAGRRGVPVAYNRVEEAMEGPQTNALPLHSQVEALYKAIEELDKIEIEKALITQFLKELSYEEIAEILGGIGAELTRHAKVNSLNPITINPSLSLLCGNYESRSSNPIAWSL